MTIIPFRRAPEPALCYYVLAPLSLGRSSRPQFDPALTSWPWVEGLRTAYEAAPGRLTLQEVGLRYADGGLEALVDDPPPELEDDAGRRLVDAFMDAINQHRVPFMDAWSARTESAELRRTEVEAEIAAPLGQLRRALWERLGPAPSLIVFDCAALGRASRGAAVGNGRRAAVSLGESAEHVLCQLLHEEVHAVIEPTVREWLDGPGKDHPGGKDRDGADSAPERAALQVGEALVSARAPQWAEAHARWRASFDA